MVLHGNRAKARRAMNSIALGACSGESCIRRREDVAEKGELVLDFLALYARRAQASGAAGGRDAECQQSWHGGHGCAQPAFARH